MALTRLASMVLGLALLIAACGGDPDDGAAPLENRDEPTTTSSGIATDLAAARKQWAEAGITTYHYEAFFLMEDEATTEYRCGLGGDIVVQVVGGVTTEAHDKLGACTVELSDPDRPPLTVEEWFALIESVVADPGPDVTELGARFDERGVPEAFFMDFASGFIDGGIRVLTEGVVENPAVEQLLTELAEARAQWEASGLTSYRFQVEVQCFCRDEYRGPFDVIVENGVVVEALRDGEPAPDFGPYDYFTVTGLFAAVEQFAYSDGITVNFDPDFGFPAIIDADPERNMIDEEQRIIVRGFEEATD